MSNNLESSASKQSPAGASGDQMETAAQGWLRVGAIAAASAVMGGLAAAWFYRKTLSRLREAEDRLPDSEFIATTDDSREDF